MDIVNSVSNFVVRVKVVSSAIWRSRSLLCLKYAFWAYFCAAFSFGVKKILCEYITYCCPQQGAESTPRYVGVCLGPVDVGPVDIFVPLMMWKHHHEIF